MGEVLCWEDDGCGCGEGDTEWCLGFGEKEGVVVLRLAARSKSAVRAWMDDEGAFAGEGGRWARSAGCRGVCSWVGCGWRFDWWGSWGSGVPGLGSGEDKGDRCVRVSVK